MDYIFFYLALSLIIMHEIDAVRCKEWRIFPGLASLGDKVGYIVFLFGHLPLFVWALWYLNQSENPDNFIIGFSLFCILHIGLHLLFYKHKYNEFKDWISWSLIVGAGLAGLFQLIWMSSC
ncbi:DUF6713 family protein [Myroides sp. DF42-4-2]|uniref:DUF6713 family protein n=1 Tax=unclassified Myroides TaxID=2642485 RepID=UPI00257762D5|nr:DUF6713 family protein [Myroides sp. DF42-4-2]MDM1407427.1 hypothetical protein [Myroides sp. DF42-4-2]